tara:strand:- start:1458 stop:1715 length:258 start_codon:yes stop_codon:yes gene_type:complete
MAPDGAPMPPEGGAPAGGAAPPEEVQKLVAEIMQMPPEQALEMLMGLFESNPQMLELLGEIAQMPPEEQMGAIQDILEGLVNAGV